MVSLEEGVAELSLPQPSTSVSPEDVGLQSSEGLTAVGVPASKTAP